MVSILGHLQFDSEIAYLRSLLRQLLRIPILCRVDTDPPV